MSDAYTPNADELLLIGTLTNVVGLRGMVRLNLVSTQPEHLAKSQPMLYSHNGKRSFRLGESKAIEKRNKKEKSAKKIE